MTNFLISFSIALVIVSSTCAFAIESSKELIQLIYESPCTPNCLEPEQTFEKLQLLKVHLIAEESQDSKTLGILETTRQLIEIYDEKAENCADSRLLALYSRLHYEQGRSIALSQIPYDLHGITTRVRSQILATKVSNAYKYSKFLAERQFNSCSQMLKDLVESKMTQETNEQIFSLRSLAETMRKATYEDRDKWRQFVKGAVEFWSSKENIVFGSRSELKKKKETEYLPKVRNLIYGVCKYSNQIFGKAIDIYKASHSYINLDQETAKTLRLASTCQDVLLKRNEFETDFFDEAQRRCLKSGILGSYFNKNGRAISV